MESLLRRLCSAFVRTAPDGLPCVDGLGIREMGHADVRSVVAIENASFGSPWRLESYSRAVADSHQHFFVAEIRRQMVGYAGFWVEGDCAHVAKLAVHPDWLRRGIGSALLEHLLDAIRRVGLGRAYLEVRVSNLAAQRLYERFGFRNERVQPRAYPDNAEDAFVFTRDDLLRVPPPLAPPSRRTYGTHAGPDQARCCPAAPGGPRPGSVRAEGSPARRPEDDPHL